MSRIKVARGTQIAYNNLGVKELETFYVCTDTHNLYFGVDLIFSEDVFKFLTVDDLNVVEITTYGLGGLSIVSFLDYTDSLDLLRAIRQAIDAAYRYIGVIVSRDITQSLLTSATPGDVWSVNFGFTIGTGHDEVNKNLFVSVKDGDSYPDDTYIVVINTGTPSNPILKFDILDKASMGGGGTVTKPSWTAPSGSDAEILNKPPLWSGNGTGSVIYNDSGNTASGNYSQATGYNTIAQNTAESAMGKNNSSHTGTIYSVGIGSGSGDRKNALEIMQNGDIYVYDLGGYDGSDYSEATRLQDIIPAPQVQSDWTQTDNTQPDYIKNKPSIPSGQVQSDWAQTNTSEVDYIKNKPTIPSAPGTLDTTETTAQTPSSSESLSGNITLHKISKTGSYTDLLNKPSIPDPQVQSDWNEADNTKPDYIKNKPSIPNAPGTLDTTATTGQTPVASESLSGNITLHKISKTGSYTDLTNRPIIPAPQVQSDWTQTSNLAVDYIKNKPVYIPKSGLIIMFNGQDISNNPDLAVAARAHCFLSQGTYNDLVDNNQIETGIAYHIEIQADWEETDSSHLGYIKNKPPILDVDVDNHNANFFYK